MNNYYPPSSYRVQKVVSLWFSLGSSVWDPVYAVAVSYLGYVIKSYNLPEPEGS